MTAPIAPPSAPLFAPPSALDQPYGLVTGEELHNQRLHQSFHAFAEGVLGNSDRADLLLAKVGEWDAETFRRFGVLVVNSLVEAALKAT